MVLSVLPVSCHSRRSSRKDKVLPAAWMPAPKEHVATGTVQKITVAGDSSQSYAVYLPPHYDDSLQWPAVYFFDPHAAGALPVKKYSVWAGEHGYILFGSNNLKNRMSSEEMNRYLRSFFDDTYRRFSLDEHRITVAGFSGGARVASTVALTDPSIRGVIACGGGLPGMRSMPQIRFDFLLFAGNEDFNLPELLDLDRALQSQSCRHYLIRFDGKHAWPDSLIFENAFFWLDFNAMRDGLLPGNDSLVRLFENNLLARLRRLPRSALREREALLSRLVTFLQDLAPVKKYEQQLSTLHNSPSWQHYQQEQAALLRKEKEQQQIYLRAFSGKSLTWWTGALGKLRQEIKETGGEEKNYRLRLLHFLSLAAYMQADAALRQHREAEAEKYVAIYKLADPENPYVYYFQAVLAARKGEREKTQVLLRKALDMGFEKERVGDFLEDKR